eukprot:477549_1
MPTSTMSMTDDSEIKSTLQRAGYSNPVKIADALQGSVWRTFDACSNSNVVIKSANKALYDLSIVIVDGIQYNVNEDILAEASILHYLTTDPLCPNALAKYINGFESDNALFIAMQDGGTHSLFDFTKTVHQCIAMGKLDIAEWHKMARLIFKQMIECIEYMHSKSVCHFDISLENTVLNDVHVECAVNGKDLTFCIDDKVQAKICDFGLAQHFPSNDFKSSKFCGKRSYKSPEVCQNKPFDAKKNDIFAAGVCLFMLVFGTAPWEIASEEDLCFAHIMNGDLWPLLKSWNATKHVNDDLMELFHGFFQYEAKRITMEEIKQNPWVME